MEPIEGLYILEDKKVVPCTDSIKWAKWLIDERQFIGKTEKGGVSVSTVFLGADLNALFEGKKPVLFETRVFGGPLNEYSMRYFTYEEAEQGHKEMCETVFGKEVNRNAKRHKLPDAP